MSGPALVRRDFFPLAPAMRVRPAGQRLLAPALESSSHPCGPAPEAVGVPGLGDLLMRAALRDARRPLGPEPSWPARSACSGGACADFAGLHACRAPPGPRRETVPRGTHARVRSEDPISPNPSSADEPRGSPDTDPSPPKPLLLGCRLANAVYSRCETLASRACVGVPRTFFTVLVVT